jgi:hypothetical protein
MKTQNLVPLALLAACLPFASRADEIEMKNGDRYVAKIVTVSNDVVVVQSDVLGTVTLPRSKVSAIRMGSHLAAPTSLSNSARSGQATATAASASSSPSATQTNLIRQVQNQYLKDADPAAKAKFEELLSGLQSGKISVNDLRAQAQSVVSQLKTFKRDLGPEGDELLDGYLGVLEGFLQDTKLTGGTLTNSPTALLKNLNAKPAGDD